MTSIVQKSGTEPVAAVTVQQPQTLALNREQDAFHQIFVTRYQETLDRLLKAQAGPEDTKLFVNESSL